MKTYERHLHPELPNNIICDTVTRMWFGETVESWKYREMLDEIAAQTSELVDAPPIPSPDPIEVPRIATKLLTDTKSLTEQTTWEALGGVAVNAQFYIPDLAKASGIIEFGCKASGTQAQLRLVEIDDDGNQRVMSDVFDVPENAGWKVKKFQTNQVPSTGDKTYELQGRLNGATSASVRYCSVVLIETT